MVTAAAAISAALAEIADAPAGTTVGAFFDFDGTLAAGFTGALLPWDRLRRGEMTTAELLGTVWAVINHSAGRLDYENFIRRGSMTLRGRHVEELSAIGQRLFTDYIAARIFPEMAELVAAHLARGHVVVLTSAAFHLQVEPVARELGIGYLLCNGCEADADGILTGEVRKPILRGKTKAQAVSEFAAAHRIDMAASYFYADGDEDIPLMMLVGNPRPTNPASGLARLAGEHRWPVRRFSSRSGTVPIARARTAVATLAAVPLIAAARLDHRGDHELLAAWWSRLVLHWTGVRLAARGTHHLDSTSDAVYVINHRSVVDTTIVAALPGTHWASTLSVSHGEGVGATLRQWLGMAPSEPRNDGAPSVLAAAEGALLTTRAIGEFDMQPFQLARDTGRPVIPIVIRNADSIVAPRSTVLHPGTVDVAILEPIDLGGLNDTQLTTCVERVRGEFITTLQNWPTAN
jgi:putative phosphoserine phosphatase/1-acylglycerol-3-phosphate O-acyltransferase